MCGIIGFTGRKKAQDILLDGLEKLEYRGYDSAGIAYFQGNGKLSLRKTAGKVSDLRAICEENDSTCGIGHTRWATHGGVSTKNAHPHKCHNVTIIHNGIIENYHELATEYDLKKDLISETDTEVAAALFHKFYNGSNAVETIRKVIPLLKGSFAFCIMFQEEPGMIYAVRNVSPMVAAVCSAGSFIASDLTAFIQYSKKYFIVPEYTILTMSDGSVSLQTLDGTPVEPEFLEVNWDVSAAQKDGYPTYMLKEINEQPDAINRTITPRIKDGLADFASDGIPEAFFENCNDITIIACGTAMYAGMVGKTLIEETLGIPVTVSIASEFRYARPVIGPNSMVIAVSQSGETIDTLEALKLAKTRTEKTLAIVNVKGSSIARESNYVLYTHAGPEIAVASTKAYTVQTAAFYLLACKLGLVKNILTSQEAKEFISELQKVGGNIAEVLKLSSSVEQLTKRMINAENAFFIGRSIDYTLSMEGALKLKEISYIHAEAYAAGELKHGTIALISEGVPVIALATQQHVYHKVISNIREVKARGAYVILLSMDDNITDPTICDTHIALPKVPEQFAIFEAVVILQLIAYYSSIGKGLNPDQPRNLAKSVTVE